MTDKILAECYAEPAVGGPNNYSQYAAPKIKDEFLALLKARKTIPYNLSDANKKVFCKFFGSAQFDFVPTTIGAHPMLRALEDTLLRIVLEKIPKSCNVCFLCSTYSEARFVVKHLAAIGKQLSCFFHLGTNDVFDGSRLCTGKTKARADLGKVLFKQLATDYLGLPNSNKSAVSGAFAQGAFTAIPQNIAFDVAVAFNCLYDIEPAEFYTFMKQHSTPLVYAANHWVPELFELQDGQIFHNTFLGVRWQTKTGRAVMLPVDGSHGYEHKNHIMQRWHNNCFTPRHKGRVFWEHVISGYGYSLLAIQKYQSIPLAVAKHYTFAPNLFLIWNVYKYSKFGIIEYFFVQRDKFTGFVEYLFSILKEGVDLSKSMMALRNRLNALTVNSFNLTENWNVMEVDSYQILNFALLYASLQRDNSIQVVSEIGKYLSGSGLLHSFWRKHFTWWYRRWIRSMKISLGLSTGLLDFVESTMRLMQPISFVSHTLQTAYWTLQDIVPTTIPRLLYGGDKRDKAVRDYYRTKLDEKVPDVFHNRAAAKLSQINLKTLLPGSKVLLFGAEPGGMAIQLARNGVVVYAVVFGMVAECKTTDEVDHLSKIGQLKMVHFAIDYNTVVEEFTPSIIVEMVVNKTRISRFDCVIIDNHDGIKKLDKFWYKLPFQFDTKSAVIKLHDSRKFSLQMDYYDTIQRKWSFRAIRSDYCRVLSNEVYFAFEKRKLPSFFSNDKKHALAVITSVVSECNMKWGEAQYMYNRDKATPARSEPETLAEREEPTEESQELAGPASPLMGNPTVAASDFAEDYSHLPQAPSPPVSGAPERQAPMPPPSAPLQDSVEDDKDEEQPLIRTGRVLMLMPEEVEARMPAVPKTDPPSESFVPTCPDPAPDPSFDGEVLGSLNSLKLKTATVTIDRKSKFFPHLDLSTCLTWVRDHAALLDETQKVIHKDGKMPKIALDKLAAALDSTPADYGQFDVAVIFQLFELLKDLRLHQGLIEKKAATKVVRVPDKLAKTDPNEDTGYLTLKTLPKKYQQQDVFSPPTDGDCFWRCLGLLVFGLVTCKDAILSQLVIKKVISKETKDKIMADGLIDPKTASKVCSIFKVNLCVEGKLEEYNKNKTSMIMMVNNYHCVVAVPKNHEVLRKSPNYTLKDFQFQKVTHFRKGQKTSPRPMLEYLKTWVDGYLSVTEQALIDLHCAAVLNFKTSITSLPDNFELAIFNGGPGCSKTFTAALTTIELIKKRKVAPSSILYVAGTRKSKDEYLEALRKLEPHDHNLTEGVYAKTTVAAFEGNASGKKGRIRTPSIGIEWIFFDESFKSPAENLSILAGCYPAARFVAFGDIHQMGICMEWYPQKEATDFREFLNVNQYDKMKMLVNDVSSRFGPDTLRMIKNVQGPLYSLYVNNMNPTIIRNLGSSEAIPSKAIVITLTTACKDGAPEHLTPITASASQGLTSDVVYIMLDIRSEAICKARKYLDSLLVLLSRHRYEIVFDMESGAHWSTLFPVSSYGGWFHESNRDFVNFDRDSIADASGFDVNFRPTEKNSFPSVRPMVTAYQRFNFADFAEIVPMTENDNQKEAMFYAAPAMFDGTFYPSERVEKEVSLISGTSFGKRDLVSDVDKTINTFAGRFQTVRLAYKNHRRVLPTGAGKKSWVEMITRKWYKYYIDDKKYKEMLSEQVLDEEVSAAFNEMLSVLKLERADAEMTWNQMMVFARGMLKNQIRAKGLVATYQNKGGQPIVASSKQINICWGLLVRVMRKLWGKCLKDNVILMDNIDEQEAQSRLKAYYPDILSWLMTDATEFDSNQTKDTALLEESVFQLFCPFPDGLRQYFRVIDHIPLFVKFFVTTIMLSKFSGFLTTMSGNIIISMIVVCMTITIEIVIVFLFKGDDTGIGVRVHYSYVKINLSFSAMIFSLPLKLTFHEKVLEFCNWFFSPGCACYNPYVLVMKIMNKVYNEVLKTAMNWYEYMDSIAPFKAVYQRDYFECTNTVSQWFGAPLEWSEFLLDSILSFCQLTYAQAVLKLPVDTYVLSRMYGGKIFDSTATHQMSKHFRTKSIGKQLKDTVVPVQKQKTLKIDEIPAQHGKSHEKTESEIDQSASAVALPFDKEGPFPGVCLQAKHLVSWQFKDNVLFVVDKNCTTSQYALIIENSKIGPIKLVIPDFIECADLLEVLELVFGPSEEGFGMFFMVGIHPVRAIPMNFKAIFPEGSKLTGKVCLLGGVNKKKKKNQPTKQWVKKEVIKDSKQEVKAEVRRELGQRMRTPLAQNMKRTKQNNRQTRKNVRKALPVKLGAEGSIMQAIATPMDVMPTRFSDGYTSEPTAVAAPFDRFDASWDGQPDSLGKLPDSDNIAFLFRDPLRNLVVSTRCPTGQTGLYQAMVIGDDDIPSLVFDFEFVAQEPTDVPIPIWVPGAEGTYPFRPHGAILYTGKAPNADQDFIWLDTGAKVNFFGSCSAGDVTLTLNYWDGDKISKNFASVTATVAAGVFNAGGFVGIDLGSAEWAAVPAGYYSFGVSTSANPLLNCGLTVMYGDVVTEPTTENMLVMAHRALPHYENEFPSIEGIRILGGSLMYSNTEAPLERQGKIRAKQLPEGTDWQDYVTSADTIGKLPQSYVTEAKNGAYGWIKPAKELDFTKLHVISKNVDLNIVSSGYPLKPEHSFLVMRVTITNVDGRDGFWTTCTPVEYTSLSSWRVLAPPRTPHSTYINAMEKLKDVVQFHDNPIHFREIISNIGQLVGRGVNWIANHGGDLGRVAATIAPLMAM